MGFDFKFDANMLESLVGGRSVLDIGRLNIQGLEQAHEFIRAYGYDVHKAADEKKLWKYHRRAVTYIRSVLLDPGEEIPEILSDPNQLKDISFILIYASTRDQKENSLQKWACSILKVMHVLVHLDNDLFNVYSGQIQDQILEPIKAHFYSDPVSGIYLGRPSDPERIALKKFDTKPFKSSDSSVTKLLAKPEEVAFAILDKVGVRFVTKHLFDTFRVMRFLMRNHLVSFPHNIPDQSNNTLYPINIFLEVMESFTQGNEKSLEEVDQMLLERLRQAGERAAYREKLNVFSGKSYRFIKFITRRLVRIDLSEMDKHKTLNFFYPFEVQIVDYQTYLENLSGDASHEKYKLRQRQRARQRVLGL